MRIQKVLNAHGLPPSMLLCARTLSAKVIKEHKTGWWLGAPDHVFLNKKDRKHPYKIWDKYRKSWYPALDLIIQLALFPPDDLKPEEGRKILKIYAYFIRTGTYRKYAPNIYIIDRGKEPWKDKKVKEVYKRLKRMKKL